MITILHIFCFLSSTLVFPLFAPASATPEWKHYSLPAYDYTIPLPATWDVFPVAPMDSALSMDRTHGHDQFFFFARYHLSFSERDIYADAVPGVPHTAPFRLANGYRAVLVTGDHACRAVVWVYHRIERYITWCGTDTKEAQLFEVIARQLDAPSRLTGRIVRPPANPPLNASITQMLALLRQPPLTAPSIAGWMITPIGLRFPPRWVVGRDMENGMCSQYSCPEYAATPTGGSTDGFEHRNGHDVWVGYQYTRLVYDDDPVGRYLFDPTYYGSRFLLANGKTALLFARDEGEYDSYSILQVGQERYTMLNVYVGHDPSTAAYRTDIVTIMQTFSATP